MNTTAIIARRRHTMSSIFNIISMHRSQQLAEDIRADQERQAEVRHAKRQAQVNDMTQEIRDNMSQSEYNAWWALAPENKFFDAACDQLLAMKLGGYVGLNDQAHLEALAEQVGEAWQRYYDVSDEPHAPEELVEQFRNAAFIVTDKFQAAYKSYAESVGGVS